MPTATAAKVADASVLAALFFGEARQEEAGALLEGAALVAPTLLGYELASVARTKALREPARTNAIVEAFALAMRLDIQWVDVEFPALLELALQTNLTAYDAAYLYTARRLGLPLVTFDARLLAATQEGV